MARRAVFLGSGFRLRQGYGGQVVSAQSSRRGGTPSPKPRQNPKILAPNGYSIFSNALGWKYFRKTCHKVISGDAYYCITSFVSRNPDSLYIFEVLAKQHEAMLLAYILSLVSDHKLAEDIAQQSFLIAYRKIGTLKDPEAFPAWLRGIARLEALSAMRRRDREFPVEPEVLQQLDEAYRRFEEQRPTETWEERFHLVEECFERLPEALQTVCRLHYFEGQKAWQIAEGLTVNLTAVLKRLERARGALRDCVRSKLVGETH